MLPPYIVEHIRQRENAKKEQQPLLELPLPVLPRRPKPKADDVDDADRGVVILELF